MSEPPLTILDGRARELAHRLAQREKRPVREILEALEAYVARGSAAAFYARMADGGWRRWGGYRSRRRYPRGQASRVGPGISIFLDTNIVSETRKTPSPEVVFWLTEHDPELALSTVVLAEIAFGTLRTQPSERVRHLGGRLADWRFRFTGRLYGLTEDAAMAYGAIMGTASLRGVTMSVRDGMIAAIARANGGRLATRNLFDFRASGTYRVGIGVPLR